MSYESISERVKNSNWAKDWPLFEEFRDGFGEGSPIASQYFHKDALDYMTEAKETVAAINGTGSPVSLQRVHKFFDSLEKWNEIAVNSGKMTYPPTMKGMVESIKEFAENNESRNSEHVLALTSLMVAYPKVLMSLFEKTMGVDVSELFSVFSDESEYANSRAIIERRKKERGDVSNNGTRNFGNKLGPADGPKKVEDVKHDSSSNNDNVENEAEGERISNQSIEGKKEIAVPVEGVRTSDNKKIVTRYPNERGKGDSLSSFKEYRSNTEISKQGSVSDGNNEPDLNETGQSLVKVLNSNKDRLTLSRGVGEIIRKGAQSSRLSSWDWFEKELLPEIVKMEVKDVEKLIDSWPSSQKFFNASPENWVGSRSFWRLVGSGRVKSLMLNGGIAKMTDNYSASSEAMFEIGIKLIDYDHVKKDKNLLEERIKFWVSIGGDLDASRGKDDSGFNDSTLRSWIMTNGFMGSEEVLNSYGGNVYNRGNSPRIGR